jgi:hypothetical protein
MSFPAAVNVLRALIWESFWQAIASRIFWVLLTVTAVCILFCLGLNVTAPKGERDPKEPNYFLPRSDPQFDPDKAAKSGVSPIEGQISLAFGTIPVPLGRNPEDAVEFIQLILSSGVAGTLGILLTLVWTAAFLPSFLEPNAASVLLTKPVPVWLLLLGKFLGVNLFVGLQASIFVVGTWAATGVSTGVWSNAYLMSVPLLMLQFAFFYSFSMFLAVSTRSAVACMVGVVLFWLLCTAVNTSRAEMWAASATGATRSLVEAAYWVLPKPVDLHKILSDVLTSDRALTTMAALKAYHPGEGSLLSCAAFTVVMLFVSSLDIVKVDY